MRMGLQFMWRTENFDMTWCGCVFFEFLNLAIGSGGGKNPGGYRQTFYFRKVYILKGVMIGC
jgi:hypothetical protein